MTLNIVHLPCTPYDTALQVQQDLLNKRQEGMIQNTLLLLSHPPVITMGQRAKQAHVFASKQTLENMGVALYETDRGGDVTFHGPGQVVGYIIADLRDFDSQIRPFIAGMGQGIMNLLQDEFGIVATYQESPYTGVWVGEEKIMAIGIAVKRNVTMHGFAFNVNTNLSYFTLINPCGLSKSVTSIEKLTHSTVDFEDIKQKTGVYVAKAMGCTPLETTLASLPQGGD